MHILLSRTDSIGDVILTLPMAGLIKKNVPGAVVGFIGRSYTEDIVKLSKYVDHFINWDKFETIKPAEQARQLKLLKADWIIHVFPNRQIAKAAKKAAIPYRAGTSHRTYHWLTCNELVTFSRRKSDLHESQLNCKLLKPLSISVPLSENLMDYVGCNNPTAISKKVNDLIDQQKVNLVLHPKSKGSAREWGLDNFQQLIDMLPADRYKIFITGSEEEGESLQEFRLKNKGRVTDTTGMFNLTEFIAFLSKIDCIVAASTGPLHIASILNKHAIGIYPPMRPMHPGRWAPIGMNTHILVKQVICSDCRHGGECHCMKEIKALEVKKILDETEASLKD